MSTYTEFASIVNSTDSTSEEVIYEASRIQPIKNRESYKNKQALLDKLEALFELYYNATKDSSTGPPKRAITKNEAEKTLTELLA
ncbi:hypothetical protein GLOIN_2v1881233 [Rhizophagus irregularis DAOM 181602=DAOM 197198]|nr:hypothetical protein GLOIN_2v1881233 [Rhizophagus irregularis DAOM 181602=DAOM 197198]